MSTQFKKGQRGNPARKPKGAKNRTTEEIRLLIQKVVDNHLEKLETDLDKMFPTNRWIILDKITKYFLPALTKNDNNNMNSGEIKITVEYQDTPPAIEHKDFAQDVGE